MVEEMQKPAVRKVPASKAVVKKTHPAKAAESAVWPFPEVEKAAAKPAVAKKPAATAKKPAAKPAAKAAAVAKTPAAKPVAKPAAATKKPAAKMPAKAAAVKPAAKSAATPKKSAVKPAAKKTVQPSAQERYRMVQTAAYYIAERCGFQGNSTEHWASAEIEIAKKLAS
jgi:hypothetical protein